MKVEILIKQYLDTILPVKDIEVEIIEDTVVLSREERWHIYINPFTMIGCFINEDIELVDLIKKNAPAIQFIYDNSCKDETI